MSDFQMKPKFYPLKPENAEGFKKAVAWFGGREFIASLKGIIMYAIYGENMDPRSWMKPNIYPNVEEKIHYQKVDKVKNKIKGEVEKSSGVDELSDAVAETVAAEEIKNDAAIQQEIAQKVIDEWAKKIFDYWEWKRTHFKFWEDYLQSQDFWNKLEGENKQLSEFWFDYIADSGDGQMGVYGVGCMCFSDLWLKNDKADPEAESQPEKGDPAIEFAPPEKKDWDEYTLLPRGAFLFVGGDTAYHSANYATLFERFQTPFRWAFTSVRKFLFEKYEPKLKLNENFFWHDGQQKPIIEKETNEENKDWDGTISAKIKEKRYLNTVIKEKQYWDSEPPRPFFGVPANHDYYDSIDGFNRQFRRPPFEDVEENMIYNDSKGKAFLQIPTFSREQEASYVAIRLPFDWWMFGIDSENEKLDFRQEVFFRQIMENKPKKLILATPEPTTVFGKKSLPAEKTTTYLKTITESLELEQFFLTDGKLQKIKPGPVLNETSETYEGYCRLDLSGDVHHYARYWGENTRRFKGENTCDFTGENNCGFEGGNNCNFKDSNNCGLTNGRFSSNNYASLVSGGGGAFFDTTSTLIGEVRDEHGNILLDKKGKQALGEIPPQKLYPSEKLAIERTADKIFDLWNIKKGGYIQYGGVIFSAIIFFFLTQFSNVSESFNKFENNLKTKGFGAVISAIPQTFSDFLSHERPVAGIILVAVMILTMICALRLNNLIKKIKEKGSEQSINETAEEEMLQLGRIKKLIITSIPFFLAGGMYVLFIFVFKSGHLTGTESVEGFVNSLFLLSHIIIAGLLVWLSFEYTNWLAVRFKLVRKFPQKTFTEKLEDPNEKADNFLLDSLGESPNPLLKKLGKSNNFFLKTLGKFVSFILRIFGKLSREYSYKYFPANLVVVLALAVLIFGIGNFGDAELGKILADLILVLVVAGGFILLAGILAYGTGAAYQDQSGKNRFLIIGLWHAVLQLFTSFILFYYAHWKVVLGIFVLVTLLNGFSKAAYRINSLFPDTGNEDKGDWRKTLRTFVNFRLVAWMMKHSKALLTVSWVIYGLIVLVAPFVLFPGSESLNETVRRKSPQIIGFFTNSPNERFVFWTYIALSFLIIGFIGYRMSRVWFSWYLGVSVLYNGHNNEAGGMARIEDFKQILRIKVEPEKLTVFVIGLDTARPNLDEKLKLKLVDKFELHCTKAT
ncbi:MAG TPA: hypothetical protein VNB22_19125 [Pyrinomonadaceae bacterium]|nr:hypothetical protein [Pyrinomonadaceae bacterium]